MLVTDVVMPQMSGEELAHRVSESHPGIPALFISG
jgi:FixJ family two-component response regulator